jgi:multiple sugar transport system permease protein
MRRALFGAALAACIAAVLLVRQREMGEEFEGITLRFSFWGSDTEIAAIEAVCRGFQLTHRDIRIRTEALPWTQYWLKMKTRAAGRSGEVPDVIRMTSLKGAEWYSRGLLLDLTALIERDAIRLDDYFRASVDAVTWEGRMRSMPTDSAVRIYMYNKDLFDRAGLPCLDPARPMSWTELREVARRLTVVRDSRVVQYGLSLGYMEFDAFVRQAGGRMVDRLVDPRHVLVDSPEGIRALEFYSALIVTDRVSPLAMQHQNLGFGAPDFALQSGKVAIQHGGTWSIPGLAKTAGLRFGLAPIAMDRERSQVAFTNSCGIYVGSRHAEEAWKFLKFFSSAEGQKLVGQKGVGIPVLRDVAHSEAFLKSPYGVEHMEVFLDELEHAETNVMVPTEEFRDEIQKIISEQLCLGSITAQTAAGLVEREGDRLLAAKSVRPTLATGVVAPVAALTVFAGVILALVARARRETRGERLRPSRGENLAGYLFISPWLAGLVAFALGPVLLALGTSFTDWSIFESPHYVGAANYARMVSADPKFWQSLKVTLVYAVTSIPIQMAGGLLCALLLNLRRVRFTGLFRTVLYLPYLFTGVAISIVWRWMYAENGLVNHALGWFGITGPAWLTSPTWALPAIILMNFTWLGGNMIIFLAALQGVPRSLYDAAEVDGAGPLGKFVHVTLPMISPAVLFNLVMGTIWSFQVFAVPWIMTEGGPNYATLFYVLNLYRRAFQYNEMGYACALAVVLFVVIFVVSLIELRGSRRWVHYEGAK